MPGGFEKGRIVPTRHGISGDRKGIHPYAVHWLFITGAGFTSHEKVSGGNGHEIGLNGTDWRHVMIPGCLVEKSASVLQRLLGAV
jgi:hypothetical protein